MAHPILDLDTLVERKPVRIDGQLYELLNPGELSILDLHKFGSYGTALEELRASALTGEYTDAQLKEISAALDKMTRLILRAPDDVQAKLTDFHKFRIVSAFNLLTSLKSPAAALSVPAAAVPAEGETPAQPTGGRS